MCVVGIWYVPSKHTVSAYTRLLLCRRRLDLSSSRTTSIWVLRMRIPIHAAERALSADASEVRLRQAERPTRAIIATTVSSRTPAVGSVVGFSLEAVGDIRDYGVA